MSNPNSVFPGPSSCRPITKVKQGTQFETVPSEGATQLEVTLPPSYHENDSDIILGPDREPTPKTEPAMHYAREPTSGFEHVPVPELAIELEPEPELEPEMEPGLEPGIVIEPLCDEGNKVNKPRLVA